MQPRAGKASRKQRGRAQAQKCDPVPTGRPFLLPRAAGCLAAVCTQGVQFPQKACQEGPHLSVCRREKGGIFPAAFHLTSHWSRFTPRMLIACIPECVIRPSSPHRASDPTPRSEVFMEIHNNSLQAGLLMARAPGVTFRVTSAGKEPRPAEVLAGGKATWE